MADNSLPTPLAKVREAKRLAEAARWELLDLVILLNSLETDLMAVQAVRELRNETLSDGEHYVDVAEEYRPGGDRPR